MDRIAPPIRTTILLVDDDAEFRTVVSDVLSAEGCQVACAANGAEALEILGALTPDLILVDLVMPIMNGWELLEKLETDPRLARVPATVLSGMPVERSIEHAQGVLHKPIDLPNLLGLLDAVAKAHPGGGGSVGGQV
jgi:CheY-like chemotaxis protein